MTEHLRVDFAELEALLIGDNVRPPEPQPMTPVDMCVANIMCCMTPDKEVFG